ncbi:hypothetical protein DPMN_048916 [Dreissena polymorpha]|uniref:Uncharacterized protein n=1 Tax=Dreissena polymorpha TaxID=45954 RepID=A0A9D4I2R9_DREPO|nr:hypothetical protein DPMN_048916 [Dreissena polymorpha]
MRSTPAWTLGQNTRKCNERLRINTGSNNKAYSTLNTITETSKPKASVIADADGYLLCNMSTDLGEVAQCVNTVSGHPHR